jgi:hypothetical protein
VFDVLEVLKVDHVPHTRKDLLRKLAYDVFESTELMSLLKTNPKIIYDPLNDSFQFKVGFGLWFMGSVSGKVQLI